MSNIPFELLKEEIEKIRDALDNANKFDPESMYTSDDYVISEDEYIDLIKASSTIYGILSVV